LIGWLAGRLAGPGRPTGWLTWLDGLPAEKQAKSKIKVSYSSTRADQASGRPGIFRTFKKFGLHWLG